MWPNYSSLHSNKRFDSAVYQHACGKKKLGQLLFGILELATEIWMQQSDFFTTTNRLVKSSSNTV